MANIDLFEALLGSYLDLHRAEVDLTDEHQQRQIIELADQVRDQFPSRDALEGLESALIQSRTKYPVLIHLSVKLAKSKQILSEFSAEFHVSIVFAIYKEHTRMLTRAEHLHGEDFLLQKIAQLRWLFSAAPNGHWEMIVVDDGCPDGSGNLAQEILARNHIESSQARVYFLEEAIRNALPLVSGLGTTNASRKGGSIQYGMGLAAQEDQPNAVILYTDADLSTHLGQVGLLVDGILNNGLDAAIGSRREPLSISIKTGVRNLRGKLFIYLWKQLLPELNQVVDTQCGFKAFRAEIAHEIVRETIEKKFAFDIELLLKTELLRANSIGCVPIAWIDSEAASTTTDLEPYLDMLKGIVKIARKYLRPAKEAEEIAHFIQSLTEEAWQRLIENVPEEIADREPYEFSSYHEIRAADLKARIS